MVLDLTLMVLSNQLKRRVSVDNLNRLNKFHLFFELISYNDVKSFIAPANIKFSPLIYQKYILYLVLYFKISNDKCSNSVLQTFFLFVFKCILWRDFRVPMAALATVARKSFHGKFTAQIDFLIGHFMLPLLMLTLEV